VQHYLIIYYKNYSHRRVPAATVTMATSATQWHSATCDQRLRYYSASAHRVRATVEYLRHATPDFISPDVWPPNSPDLSGRPSIAVAEFGAVFKTHVYQKRTRNINELKQHLYGHTFGRQSLTGPSISGKSSFRPLFVWKDAISNMSCKSSFFLLTFLPPNLQVL